MKIFNQPLISVFIFACLIGIFNPTDSMSQWTQVSGLYGEPVYCVRASSTKLFAMTLNGVYDSNDNGQTWAEVPDLYLTNVIERMSASGDTIVAFAFPESYVSTDDGANWDTITAPANGSVFGSELIVENGTLYMPTYGDYLYTSTNGGTSWNQVTSGLTTAELNCASAQGNTVFVGTDDGVFKSSNNGILFSFS